MKIHELRRSQLCKVLYIIILLYIMSFPLKILNIIIFLNWYSSGIAKRSLAKEYLEF